ncbi:MAG: DUF72 domain-containing protein [Caldimonas sp.]
MPSLSRTSHMRIGTAGWSLTKEVAADFPGADRHLQRYARVLDCAEINSSFHRSHRVETYERWAASTPSAFRFAVKLPRSITHDARLCRVREPLRRFLDEAAGLGERLAVLLVQLPPSFAFELRPVRLFFRTLCESFNGCRLRTSARQLVRASGRPRAVGASRRPRCRQSGSLS